MALIYASAVNRRMNALQKKHSVDLIATNQHSPHQEIAHCTQRSNEERHLINGGGGRQLTREGSQENDRKRSAPQSVNRANGDIGQSINGSSNHSPSPISNSKPSLAIQHPKKGNSSSDRNHPKASRKMTVADDQLFHPVEPLFATINKARRKISTPVMAQSVMRELKMGSRGGHNKKDSKANSPDSICSSFEDEHQQQNALHQFQQRPKVNRILASFGRAVRRRSVSADATVFRMRGGTNSSMDSSQEGEGSLGARKSSAFQKMKERLNKWKLSG